MKSTARAIILRNKRLLLVTGHGADYYWTPGGNVEEEASHQNRLCIEKFEKS